MEFFDTLCRVIFYFMIYSVVGWIYETTLCSITDRHFVNRGFLNGPYCPIYGSGALLDVLILGRIENPFLLFILGVARHMLARISHLLCNGKAVQGALVGLFRQKI